MKIENISSEFAYEFFMQVKKASEKEETIKPKIKNINEANARELPFIRPLTVQKRIIARQLPKKAVVQMPERREEEKAIDKVERLMEDSTIDAIECYGPEEGIKIRRGERITESKVILSEEDIKEIFNEVEKEHGKNMGKIFKTNFRNFTFNGIRSRFIGSSFVVERKETRTP